MVGGGSSSDGYCFNIRSIARINGYSRRGRVSSKQASKQAIKQASKQSRSVQDIYLFILSIHSFHFLTCIVQLYSYFVYQYITQNPFRCSYKTYLISNQERSSRRRTFDKFHQDCLYTIRSGVK